jgi:hypothetical protein
MVESVPCAAATVGVAHGMSDDEHPVSLVRGTDARSRIMERDDFVSFTLQVR